MKKSGLLFLIFSLFTVFAIGQQRGAKISFEKDVHDFGKIKEEGGTVEYEFKFTNTGDEPLVITNVRTTCGCTSPTWTQKPVLPGQKGFVKAAFDPGNRPGNFNKSIIVSTNTINTSRVVLRITGEVLPREKTIEDYYPKTIGELRLQSNHFPFTRVYNNQVKTDTLNIYNASDHLMKLDFVNVPDYLNLTILPRELKPGEKGYIIGEYDGRKVNDWGFVVHRLSLLINGQNHQSNYITISAKIEEDFSHLTDKQRENAPSIEFEERNFNFGKIPSAQKHIEKNFVFKNTGKSDLVIHKIRTTCGCTTANPEKTVLQPGESSSFKAIFTPGSRKGMQRKSIYVISNDPANPEVRLMIRGEIID
ncbi:MAG: DUF1573 domain-containing protein [Bacteroidales bacterium]|jgi:hypothetical protein|nr:DUF1573 domain-containing protein [Bacteroidales bacterium]